MKSLTIATVLVGALGLTTSMMVQAQSSTLSIGPCDDGYRVYELDVCVPDDADYGADYKKAIGIIKKELKDQHGILDFLHVENLVQLPGNGNFTSFLHTKDKKIKVLMHNWKVTEALISGR